MGFFKNPFKKKRECPHMVGMKERHRWEITCVTCGKTLKYKP